MTAHRHSLLQGSITFLQLVHGVGEDRSESKRLFVTKFWPFKCNFAFNKFPELVSLSDQSSNTRHRRRYASTTEAYPLESNDWILSTDT